MKDFAESCVYQIYPKSFKDTSSNGIGDLKGITEKLDYLKELGVDYLWITPFFVSPQMDNGYDIEDYYNIDPLFGTMEDLDQLIEEASKKNIGLMFDMVLNHTSTKHEWFQKALQGDPKYKDYYIFKMGENGNPPTNWISKFGGNAWEFVENLGEYYLHLFDKSQADLNWENPNVRQELKEIILFWKNKGIRGFRFDVINLISKPDEYIDDFDGDGKRFYTDGKRVHEYLRELIEDTGLDKEDIITVGEMSSTTIEHCVQYSNPKEKQLKMCFNFHHLKVDYKNGDKWSLKPYDFIELKDIFNQWQIGMAKDDGWNAVFWCNHDQPRVVSRFGDDKDYHMLSAKMLATAIHTLRGTPYIYQGEEIGMTNAYFSSISQYRDVESLHYFDILKQEGKKEEEIYHILAERSRDNSRTPMQWNQDANSGFSSVTPWIEVNKNYREINVVDNLEHKDSIFYYYQSLILLRKKYKAISRGNYMPLLEEHQGIFAYERNYNNEKLVVVTNFTKDEQFAEILEVENYKCLLSNYERQEFVETGLRLKAFEAVVLYKNIVLAE